MSWSLLTFVLQGGDNNLGVALASYEPHVQCVDGSIGPPGSTVPPLKSCNIVVGLMFATKDVISFGKAGSGATKIVPGMDACKATCHHSGTRLLLIQDRDSSGSFVPFRG